MFTELVAKEGFLALYRGVTPVLLRAFPANAVSSLIFRGRLRNPRIPNHIVLLLFHECLLLENISVDIADIPDQELRLEAKPCGLLGSPNPPGFISSAPLERNRHFELMRDDAYVESSVSGLCSILPVQCS